MNKLTVFGTHDENTLAQMNTLLQYGSVERAALLADGHYGFGTPVGAVVGYSEHVSVGGVGFDIGCGIKAVKTSLTYGDVLDLGKARIADAMAAQIAFGVGRVAEVKTDHELFDSDAWGILRSIAGHHEADRLRSNARNQLGTVGGGNHWAEILVEQTSTGTHELSSPVWITAHFGSRGFGHSVATGFLKIDKGFGFAEKLPKGVRLEDDVPALLELGTDNATAYLALMRLGGQYAYAGRDIVVQQVLDILGAEELDSVHNHHNYSFTETHGGKELQVVRKGATPLAPGQRGAVGGSMCDISVILKGREYQEGYVSRAYEAEKSSVQLEQAASLYSTVHGAGRVMSRMAAKGKRKYRTGELILNEDGTPKRPGLVSREMMEGSVQGYGIELRGGDLDESAFVYRKLQDVLDVHQNTAKVETILRPVIVCMAGAGVADPFKD